MRPPASPTTAPLLPLVTPVVLVAVWAAVASAQIFPPSLFPHPWNVARGVWSELTSGRRAIDAVVGPSGCGKTTLLNLCSGWLSPTTGRVHRPAGRQGAGRPPVHSRRHRTSPDRHAPSPMTFVPFGGLDGLVRRSRASA